MKLKKIFTFLLSLIIVFGSINSVYATSIDDPVPFENTESDGEFIEDENVYEVEEIPVSEENAETAEASSDEATEEDEQSTESTEPQVADVEDVSIPETEQKEAILGNATTSNDDQDYEKFLSFSTNFEQPYPDFENSDKTTRYTVLTLDVSGSLEGEPMTKMRTAAKKFCESMLRADGNNYIAIVTYTGYTVMMTNFTSNYNYLERALDSMECIYRGTNIQAGMADANRLLFSVTYKHKRVDNVVIMTDGLPNNGTFTKEGLFDASESAGFDSSQGTDTYGYANGTVNYFNNSLTSNANVYSFGFFHSMTGNELEFGRKLINAIQNSGAYEVNDPESLVFEFGKIADAIVDNDHNNPIIIVPGIMGSSLYDQNDDQVWVTAFSNGDLDLKDNPILTVRHNNDNQTTQSKREYGAGSVYRNLVDSLCNAFPNREVYFFSYDWRLSNEYNAEKLFEAINRISAKNDMSVDIVAHSMGGLVTSRYVSKYGNNKIDKIITCGTPYEGSPALLDRALTYKSVNILLLDLLVAIEGIRQSEKQAFNSIAELTPTDGYYNNHPNKLIEIIRGNNRLAGPHKYVKTVISNEEYHDFCKSVFRGITGNNYAKALEFHNNIKNITGAYNILRDTDNTYFIVGTAQKTIESVGLTNDNTIFELYYETIGDGTVPYDSSTMNGALNRSLGKDEYGNDRYVEINTDHSGTASCDEAVKHIINVLANKNENMPIISNSARGYLYIRIACPVEVTLEKNGEFLSSAETNLNQITSFGRLDFSGEEGEIKHLCLDEDEYNLVLEGTGKGTMDLTLEWRDENNETISEKEYLEIPVTSDTEMTIVTNKEGISELNVDTDGDGNTDETWYAGPDEIGYQISDEKTPEETPVPVQQIDDKPVKKTSSPDTSDSSNALLYTIIIFGALSVFGICEVLKRKLKN